MTSRGRSEALPANAKFIRLDEANPFLALVKQVVRDRGNKDEEFEIMLKKSDEMESDSSFREWQARIIICARFKEMANLSYAHGKFQEAIRDYKRALSVLLCPKDLKPSGKKNAFPVLPLALPTLNNEYMAIYSTICGSDDSFPVQSFLLLVSCYNNIAWCCYKCGDVIQVVEQHNCSSFTAHCF